MLLELAAQGSPLMNPSTTYIVYLIKMCVPPLNVLTCAHLACRQRERQGTPVFRLAYHDLPYLSSHPHARGVYARTT